MRSRHAAIIGAVLTAVAGPAAAQQAQQQAQQPEQMESTTIIIADVEAVALGYRLSQLIGQEVRNDKGQAIGRLDDFIINKDRVLFATLSVGGFLGIGDRLVAMPYTSLQVTEKGVVAPGATKEALSKLPEFKYRS